MNVYLSYDYPHLIFCFGSHPSLVELLYLNSKLLDIYECLSLRKAYRIML